MKFDKEPTRTSKRGWRKMIYTEGDWKVQMREKVLLDSQNEM